MIKRNVSEGLEKCNLKDLVDQTKTLVDLREVIGKYGKTVVAVFSDETYCYVPSSDIEYCFQLLDDAPSMSEIKNGYDVTVKVHTSKTGNIYYTLF